MPATTSTRRQVKAAILNELNPGLHAALARFYQPLVTTAVGGTTTVLDSKRGRGTVSANAYDGCQIEIVETVTDGPTEDAAAARAGVDAAGFSDPATLTFSPAMTAVQSGTDYLLFAPWLTPELIESQMNRVLRNTEAPYLWGMSQRAGS